MKKWIAIVVATVLVMSLVFALPTFAGPGGDSSSTAANKIVAQGSTLQVYEEADKTDIRLCGVTGKFSDPTDLMIQFSAETALYTEVKAKGKDVVSGEVIDEASAKLEVWVTIDGTTVPVTNVSQREELPNGPVVFDYRLFGIETNIIAAWEEGDLVEEFIRLWIETRSAHTFNWVALNIGEYNDVGNDGIYEIEVWAEIDVETGAAENPSYAAVGPRVLIVEPCKMATGSNL